MLDIAGPVEIQDSDYWICSICFSKGCFFGKSILQGGATSPDLDSAGGWEDDDGSLCFVGGPAIFWSHHPREGHSRKQQRSEILAINFALNQ